MRSRVGVRVDTCMPPGLPPGHVAASYIGARAPALQLVICVKLLRGMPGTAVKKAPRTRCGFKQPAAPWTASLEFFATRMHRLQRYELIVIAACIGASPGRRRACPGTSAIPGMSFGGDSTRTTLRCGATRANLILMWFDLTSQLVRTEYGS